MLKKQTKIAVSSFLLFNPKGPIAASEHDLMIRAILLMLFVAIPILAVLYYTAWKYRATRPEIKNESNTPHKVRTQFLWWGIPTVTILILANMMWKGTKALDPYKPIASDKTPITIQVVAMEWKWLFIYPEQHIATVNFVEFPTGTPVNFELTADAPMNSFWIPQLAGQIYAMPGMSTQLHMLASENGDYAGSAAEINGKGFAGMKFTAKATSDADFANWVSQTKALPQTLTLAEYDKLNIPSEYNPPTQYANVQNDLYDIVMMKFMMPKEDSE